MLFDVEFHTFTKSFPSLYYRRGPISGEYVPYEEIEYHFGIVCMG